ncbi:hypothetical protein GGF50DRAFT_51899 [Schizophyllum commune]
MSDHSDDKCFPDQPISERACTGRRVSYARTQLGEFGQSATNANVRRPLRAPSPHERAPQQPHSFTSFPRTGLMPWPSPAPQAFLPIPEYSIASRSYFGALASPTESASHATRHGLPTIRYPSSLPSISIPEVPPICHTLHALLQRVPPRHRSGASSCSGFGDALSTSSSRDVRQVDGYSADASSNEEDTADEAIVEAGARAASKEAAGHRNGDVAAEGGDEDDLVPNIEPSGSTRSDSDTPAHDSFGENVDVDELDSEEYADVRTRYRHTGIWHDAQGLYRVLRDRDGRQEVEIPSRYSLIRQTEVVGSPSAAAYPPTGEREAGPSSSGDEHDEGSVHHPPQVDLQLEQASWTPTSATRSSTGTASQHEPSPPIIRPSIPNLLNVEDMEVPRPWGPSAGIAEQLVASATASPRGANRHMDTGATIPAATDAIGQGAQTPAGMSGSYSVRNRSPILLGPGSRFSIRLSVRSPTPTTEPALPPEDLAGAAEHGAPDRFSQGFVPASPEEAALLLEVQAGNAWPSPATNTGMLSPGTNQGDVLSPDATSATLTGGTINIGLPEIDPSASTESAKVPAPVLHDSTECGQQGQRPRRPSAHPPLAHPPSPHPSSPLPSTPHQEPHLSQPSPSPSGSSQWPPWKAMLIDLLRCVLCEIEGDEASQDATPSLEPASSLPSTSRMAAAPLHGSSKEKKDTKGKSRKKDSKAAQARIQVRCFALIATLHALTLLQAHEGLARIIEASEGPVNLMRNACSKAAQLRGESLPAFLRLDIPYNLTAGRSERVVDDHLAASQLNDSAEEGGMETHLDASVDGEEVEESVEQVEDVHCVPVLMEVVEPGEGQTAEERIEELKDELIVHATQILRDSEARAIATDLNNPPISDADGQPEASTSAQLPPLRGPRNPVYPAQTRVIVFIACEDAYTYTVVSLAGDASPLRVLNAPESALPSNTSTRIHLGEWEVFSRSLVEAAAMEEEGMPEEPLVDVAAAPANVGTAANGEAAGANANDAQQGAKVDETQTVSEKRKKNATSKGGKKIKKPAAPKPRPRLLTRAEILSRHQKWTPIRRGMPSAEELVQILAMAMSIVELSYPFWARLSGTRSILDGLDLSVAEPDPESDEEEGASETEDAAAQNADGSPQGGGARSSGRKRQRSEDGDEEDEGANNAGPSRSAKKRKTAPATSSQQAPAASSQQAPAPRGNKRHRDEATEDAAPAPKRTRRDEEPAGSANPRPSARASTSQAPRMIAPAPLVESWPSLEAAKRAAADEQRLRESMSRPSASAPRPAASVPRPRASVSRQPPRTPVYRPPPGPPVAGPSRPPVAGPSRPSRPNRKRRRTEDETDDDEDDEDYVDEGGPVTWESGRRAKKSKRR